MLSEPGNGGGDEGRFRLAMASSGIGMAIVDLQGRWLDVNPALERMFGYPAAEILGRSADEFTHPDDIAVSRGYLDALRSGAQPVLEAEKRYLRRDGSTLWAHVNVAAMHGPGDELGYLIVQVRDISAQREAETALKDLNDTLERRVDERAAELQSVVRQQEMFAYGVAHDLRAPLRAIDSFATLLANHDGARLDDTGRDYLARIRAATARLATLLDGLLDLSRAARADLRPQPVDVSLLAEWVCAELSDADPGREAVIDVQPDIVVCGDERQLKVLLDQLLHNAWKFSRERNRVEITVGARRDGDMQEIEIRDAGIGFDMRYADKMFEPFQRLHGPEQAGGNGIGLAIAQRIVQRHKGTLAARSEPGAGSVFTLRLPAVRDDDDDAGAA